MSLRKYMKSEKVEPVAPEDQAKFNADQKTAKLANVTKK